MNTIGKGFRRGGVSYPKLVKADGVESYQQTASLIVRLGRPPGWAWDGGLLRITYRFHLIDNVDCDNLLKALNDAIAGALDINDKWFLPCVEHKDWANKGAKARVEVTIG
jgi:Holliday junction resolvase RusA-like endonuclease